MRFYPFPKSMHEVRVNIWSRCTTCVTQLRALCHRLHNLHPTLPNFSVIHNNFNLHTQISTTHSSGYRHPRHYAIDIRYGTFPVYQCSAIFTHVLIISHQINSVRCNGSISSKGRNCKDLDNSGGKLGSP